MALAARSTELADANAALAARSTELADANAALAARSTELADANAALAARTGELADANMALAARSTELTDATMALAARTGELADAKTALAARTTELGEAQKKADDERLLSEIATSELDIRGQQLNVAESALHLVRESVSEERTLREMVTLELEVRGQELRAVEAKLDETTGDLVVLRREVAAAQETLADERTRHEMAQGELARALHTAEAKVEETTRALAASSGEMALAREAAEHERSRSEMLNLELEVADQSLSEAEAKSLGATTALATLRAEAAAAHLVAQSTIDAEHAACEAARNDAAKLHASLDEARAELEKRTRSAKLVRESAGRANGSLEAVERAEAQLAKARAKLAENIKAIRGALP